MVGDNVQRYRESGLNHPNPLLMHQFPVLVPS